MANQRDTSSCVRHWVIGTRQISQFETLSALSSLTRMNAGESGDWDIFCFHIRHTNRQICQREFKLLQNRREIHRIISWITGDFFDQWPLWREFIYPLREMSWKIETRGPEGSLHKTRKILQTETPLQHYLKMSHQMCTFTSLFCISNINDGSSTVKGWQTSGERTGRSSNRLGWLHTFRSCIKILITLR